MSYNYSIISDDQQFINKLKQNLNSDLKFEWLAVSYEQTIKNFLEKSVELMFIDLDCTSLKNPFFILHELGNYTDDFPEVIGVSVDKLFAFDCIKNSFSDFILKPLSEFELRKTLLKFEKKRKTYCEKLCLKSKSNYKFIRIEDILYLNADNNTTDFFLSTGKKITGFESLKQFEEILPANFYRIHKSYIVNVRRISEIHLGKGQITIYRGGEKTNIPFSKTYREDVKKLRFKITQSNFMKAV